MNRQEVATVPSVSMRQLLEAGHQLMTEAPDATLAALKEFLA